MDQNKNNDLPNNGLKDKPATPAAPKPELEREVGGYKGQDPTTHGDWQHKGRTTDF